MSVGLLVALASLQGGALLVMLIALIGGHAYGTRRTRRRERETALAGEVVGRWFAGALEDDAVRRSLDGMMVDSVAVYLQSAAVQRADDGWERLVRLARGTAWFRRLRSQTDSRFWWRRLRAARALSILAVPEDLPVLHALVADEHPTVKLAAAVALQRVPSPALIRGVLAEACDAPPVARRYLLEVLAGCGADLLPPLLERLETPGKGTELRTLLDLAGEIGIPSLLRTVLPHASSGDLEIRIGAAGALGAYPHPRASRALVRLLRDDRWEVRTRAAASLGAIGAVEAASELRATLSDPNWWVRLRSAIALRRLGPAGTEILHALSPDEDRFACEMARFVLRLDDSAMAEYAGAAGAGYGSAA